jgi:hypothetical protein
MFNFWGTIGVDTLGIGLAFFGLLAPIVAALIHVGSELAFILNSARLRHLGGCFPLAWPTMSVRPRTRTAWSWCISMGASRPPVEAQARRVVISAHANAPLTKNVTTIAPLRANQSNIDLPINVMPFLCIAQS